MPLSYTHPAVAIARAELIARAQDLYQAVMTIGADDLDLQIQIGALIEAVERFNHATQVNNVTRTETQTQTMENTHAPQKP